MGWFAACVLPNWAPRLCSGTCDAETVLRLSLAVQARCRGSIRLIFLGCNPEVSCRDGPVSCAPNIPDNDLGNYVQAYRYKEAPLSQLQRHRLEGGL